MTQKNNRYNREKIFRRRWFWVITVGDFMLWGLDMSAEEWEHTLAKRRMAIIQASIPIAEALAPLYEAFTHGIYDIQ